MRGRSFLRWVCLFLLSYMAFNLITWKLITEDLLTAKKCAGGDLTRLGYITGSKMCRQNEDSLPRKHIEWANFTGGAVDVVTIGDSFSNGGGGGKDRYYQDHLASLQNFTVLNIPQYEDIDKITTLAILNNNGFLERLKPRFVVLECAEKMCLQDLPDAIDFALSSSCQELNKHKTVNYHPPPQEEDPLKVAFFSEANLKFIRNSVLYHFSDNAYGSPVYKAKLNKSFFSVSEPDILLFLHSDIKFREKYTVSNIVKFNNYLNALSGRLRAKGITLYFMPCVDKYNLYSEYIAGNPYPRSNFFEELRKLRKKYEFIDTKQILGKELSKGKKDIFYSDDTHWSWKASRAIFEQVIFH